MPGSPPRARPERFFSRTSGGWIPRGSRRSRRMTSSRSRIARARPSSGAFSSEHLAPTGFSAKRRGSPGRARRDPRGRAALATGFPFRQQHLIDRYLSIFRALFLKSRSIRRAGSAVLDLAYVAAGIFDGFFEFGLSPWDTAAGALLVTEAGGLVTDFDGGASWRTRGNVLAATPGVHAALLEVMREIGVGEKDL